MKLILSLIFIFSCSVYASEGLTYLFGNQGIVFVKVDNLVVNRSCSDKNCLAFKNGSQSSRKKLTAKDTLGGKNPMAVRCKKFMDGRVLIGVDREGNEQSFCVFKDDSYLRN